MTLHTCLTSQAPCNIKKCCCCCELWSINTCVLLLGILITIEVPFCLIAAIISQFFKTEPTPAEGETEKASFQFNYEAFMYWMGFGYALSMMIGFYAGYCAKKAWGRWTMFHCSFQAVVFTIVMIIVLFVAGPSAFE